MKKLLALLGLLVTTPLFAADNALVITPGAGVIMRTIDDGSAHQIGTSVPVGVNGTSAWGTAGTSNTNILTVQGIAAMTPLLVTAAQSGTWNITNISGTVSLPTGASTSALQPTNAAQASTTAAQTGYLAMGAVTTAAPTYVTAQTNPVSLDTAGNLRTFVTNTNANGQATAANSSPVVLASDVGGGPDPCFGTAKSTASFSSATSGGQIVAGTSSKRTYVCSITIITSTAANVSLIEGAGSSVCTTGTTAVWGNTGTTAANGFPFGATGGVTLGTGVGTVAQTATNANNLCLLFTTTNTPTVVATVAYVQK